MSVKVVLYAAKQVSAGIAPIYIVITICVDLHVKLDICLHKSLCQFRCILIMHIVISCAMDDKQVSFKVAVAVQRRAVVAIRILLRREIGRAHV